MKKCYFVLTILVLMSTLAFAKTPVYVDLEEANTTISELQAANDAAETQNSELTSENDSLIENTSQQRDKITQAQGIITDLRVARGDLYGAKRRANDLEQKKRIIEQFERNQAQEYQLSGMIDKFNGIIKDNDINYTANRKQIARNNLTVQENTDEINYLNSCIDLTSNNENSLTDIFNRQDEASSDFDSFMSANQ